MDLVKGEPAGAYVLRNLKFIPKQWLSGFRSTCAGTIPDIIVNEEHSHPSPSQNQTQALSPLSLSRLFFSNVFKNLITSPTTSLLPSLLTAET